MDNDFYEAGQNCPRCGSADCTTEEVPPCMSCKGGHVAVCKRCDNSSLVHASERKAMEDWS